MMEEDPRIKALEQKLNNNTRELEILKQENNSLKESAKQLQERIKQFKGLIYSSTSLITFLKGPEYIIEFANKPIKKIWGKGNDVEGKPLFEVVPEIRTQGIEEYLHQVFYKGEPFHAKSLPVDHEINGELVTYYFDFSYMPQYDSKGKIIGIGVIAQDITNQELLHQKIKKSETEFRELVNFMPHKISLADAEGNSLFYNQSWLSYTGKTCEEMKTQSSLDIIHPEERDKAARQVEKSLASGSNIDIEIRILDKNGDYKWHLAKATPIRDEDGKITSWISSSTEIQKLKEEEKRKEDFLKLVSHELKTPVTSIKGYVQLLLALLPNQNGATEKRLKIKPYLNRIETQVERLIRLLSEMLDMSRIELNELELKNEKFNLNKHVEEIVEDLTYSNKDIQIAISHQLDCDVFADRGRIGQVIINFVTNALKYSPESKRVDIKIFRHQEDQVAVSVRDFGIGIEKNEQNQIFKRFYRVAGNNDDTYAGFGIGLYLSNEIIERHNGKIFVKSELGKGSEFTFTIPLNQE